MKPKTLKTLSLIALICIFSLIGATVGISFAVYAATLFN